jgi:hypothetical protein
VKTTVKTTGANRSFGLLFAGFCALLALLGLRAGRPSAIGWGIAAAVFSLVALTMPRILAPLRRLWLRLGRMLSHVVNPLVLGVIYAVVFVPVAAAMRLARRDAMGRRPNPAAASYWIARPADRLITERLKEQF